MDVNETLTLEDIARIFHVSTVTVYRWINFARAGKGSFPLPIGTIGQKLRWSKQSIIDYQTKNSTMSKCMTCREIAATCQRRMPDGSCAPPIAAEMPQDARNAPRLAETPAAALLPETDEMPVESPETPKQAKSQATSERKAAAKERWAALSEEQRQERIAKMHAGRKK